MTSDRLCCRQALRHLVWLLPTIAACVVIDSCVTIPQAYKELANDEGIQGNDMHRFAGFDFLTTTAFVPGGKKAELFPKRHVDCARRGMSASVLWVDPVIHETDARQACRWVLRAVEYVAGHASDPRVTSIHFRLFLVPEGQTAEMHAFSWRPLGQLRPLYLAHWQLDAERTKASILSTFAHEATHLDTFVLGIRESRPENEDVADLAGACAQLVVIGRIDRRNYQNGVPADSAEFHDRQLNPSLVASGAFAAGIAPLFNPDGLILADSDVGRAFKKHCAKKLTKLFQDTSR